MKRRSRLLGWIAPVVIVVLAAVAVVLWCPTVSRCVAAYTTPEDPAAPYVQKAGYRSLSEELKRDYRCIVSAIEQTAGTDATFTVAGETEPGVRVLLPCPVTDEEELYTLYLRVAQDNPQFFFLHPHYRSESWEFAGNRWLYSLYIRYTDAVAARTAAITTAEGVVRDWVAALPEQASDFERERLLHDRLLAYCEYDEQAAATAADKTADITPYTAYGALVNGRAVCAGYADALLWLLTEAGIPCDTVAGRDEKDSSHQWLLVSVDGDWYHLDPTWDDGDLLRHTYFNVTDEAIALTHTADGENPPLPACTATAANYFVKTGAHLSAYSDEAFVACLAAAWREGDTAECRFETAEEMEAALAFVEDNRAFFAAVNAQLPEGRAVRRVQYQPDPQNLTVTFKS